MADKNMEEVLHEKTIVQELHDDPFHKFNVAFALMSIIPFLVFLYIISSRIATIDVLVGESGLILSISIFVSLCGLLVGYGVLHKLLKKVIYYAAKAKKSDTLKSNFVATVSHDLRNPISAINANMAGLQEGLDGELNDGQKEVVGLCVEVTDRMQKMVDNLLNIYRIEAGMQKLDKSDCDLQVMLNGQVDEFKALAKRRGIEILRQFSLKNPVVSIDGTMVCEVVNNILGNAVKYSDDDSIIAVKLLNAGDFVRIEVEDSAECIPEDYLEKIFDKFQRHSESHGGAGLGLAIAKDMVELHGGRIWAECIPDKGNKFVFVLPR